MRQLAALLSIFFFGGIAVIALGFASAFGLDAGISE